ncbi:MAG: flippase-like domain-containing protein [Flavobacteriales bacterium]|nr:flippase-like domain-containing protein [Flavobacteriales bacterium]
MSARRSLLMAFRWVIFLLACVFLYVKLAGAKGIVATTGESSVALLVENRGIVSIVGLLMLANWWIESFKWRRLMIGVEVVGPWRAFMATIAGTSVGFVSVNRTGEFIGRVLFLAPENRISGGFATALGSIAQFVVTLVAGALGLLFLTVAGLPLPWPMGWISWALATLTTLVTMVALVLYGYPGLFRQVILLVPFARHFDAPSQVLARFERSELIVVLLLSAVRYLVFGLQFILLLRCFGTGLPAAHVFLGVPLIYLIATLIPSVMLTELGVRGSVAVAVFSPLGGEPSLVLLATSVLWMINVALPASVGSLILLFARIRVRAGTEA